jgi:hypothetical protein
MTSLSLAERRVQAILARQYRKHGHAPITSAIVPTPVDAIQQREDAGATSEEIALKQEAVAEFLGFVFEVGPSPARVLHRLYSLVRVLHPELIMSMNRSELARLLGQTRAAQSHRERLLFGELCRRGGYKSLSLPDQKSDTAVKRYRRTQRGNRNRNKAKRAA